MNCRLCWPLVGLFLVAGCAREANTPDGGFLLDEDITLVRGADLDSAQRDISVDGDSVIIAIVDEMLTDVSVRLSVESPARKSGEAVEVENHFSGAGIEVAALEVRGEYAERVKYLDSEAMGQQIFLSATHGGALRSGAESARPAVPINLRLQRPVFRDIGREFVPRHDRQANMIAGHGPQDVLAPLQHVAHDPARFAQGKV